ncbi:hypothetical protein PSAB6_330051 [Paraburkholderia sabiae]|nr:hypothetical protein PSAB6_330051 [Paraburkholderia sabiae]
MRRSGFCLFGFFLGFEGGQKTQNPRHPMDERGFSEMKLNSGAQGRTRTGTPCGGGF